MSKADDIFIAMCKDIIENGTTTEGQEVRPHWEDGTPAYTIKKFGFCAKYDLREEFPALTLRRTGLKSCMDEVLWIYQRKSNNINDLNTSIWDEWADEDGSIGKAYGYQVQREFIHHIEKISWNGIKEKYGSFDEYCTNLRHYGYQNKLIGDPIESFIYNNKLIGDPIIESFMYNNLADCNAEILNDYIFMDQMDSVLYDLKNNPFSRRIMINLWDIKDLNEMNLYPCCYNIIFNVTDEGQDKLVLNMTLNQRSNDVLAANNWNVCQYAILLMMVAQVSNMIPGQLMHCITDVHIYDRHIDLVKELISRETYPAPKVKLNPDIEDFYLFDTDDLIVEDYQYGPQIKNIPIAI